MKKIIDKDLAKKAEDELKKSDKGRIYLKLMAIKSAGYNKIDEVARHFNVSRNTICSWGKSFRDEGISGLYDNPKGHYPSKLGVEHKNAIAYWLERGRNADGEPVHWTIDLLKSEIMRIYNISITYNPLYKLLSKLGFKQKVPRPVHVESSKEAKDAFKKNS